jgi:hypothetical protein
MLTAGVMPPTVAIALQLAADGTPPSKLDLLDVARSILR